MDGLGVFLVELCADTLEHCLELADVDLSVSTDITGPKQFLVSNISLLDYVQQFEHGSVLERDIVVAAILGGVVLDLAVIGLQSVLELLQRDVVFHIFIQNQNQS